MSILHFLRLLSPGFVPGHVSPLSHGGGGQITGIGEDAEANVPGGAEEEANVEEERGAGNSV